MYIDYDDDGYAARLSDQLVGNSVTEATEDVLTLSNGTRLQFDKGNSDCCSWLDLKALRPTSNIITAVFVEDDESKHSGEYRAWIRVVTEGGEMNIAEAEGDASNGYYLHGFALGVKVLP